MSRYVLLLVAPLLACPGIVSAGEELLGGGDFEQGTTGWGELWTRTPGGRAVVDSQKPHAGRQAVRVEHTGSKDWSFQRIDAVEVQPGQIYEFSGWVRLKGQGTAQLCVTMRGAEDRVIDWAFAGRSTAMGRELNSPPIDWHKLRCRFVVPRGAESMIPRLIGNGPAVVGFDDVTLSLEGTIDELRTGNLSGPVVWRNEQLEMKLHPADGRLEVIDRRLPWKWTQAAPDGVIVLSVKPFKGGCDVRLLRPADMLQIDAAIRLDPKLPEISVELSADGELDGTLAFPGPFVTDSGTFLVMPVNEGISYPVADESLPPMHYHLYGGHGLCMGWYGVIDGPRALMTLVETPDDAAVRVPRKKGRLYLQPEWQPQRGKFGPARKLRYVFFDRGGYVAMCKRYRRHAQQTGLLKTLAEKRKENAHVDMLVGAVNVWCWDNDAVGICRELQSAGIERILWSHRGPPDVLRQLNELGVLTSRYDIYQDTMDPANFPKLWGVHPDWTTDAWPHDLMRDEHGQRQQGWRVKAKDGSMIPCGVLCDRQAVEYARRRVPAELKTHPYRCRFIDTTTASPWRECYDPDHPMTRTQSRHGKMQLLRYMSEDCKLVTGSETGHEAAVPYVHYFEGMMSLGPYRVPDAGRAMMKLVDEVPERVAKFQTGHYYRLPLWELVYHDCVVAQWYWGDYNNKLPKLWDRRDLLNALYGTPPMFMFDRQRWQDNRDRFVESYKTIAPIARATGYREMLSHRWLTDDHAVQQTQFAGGVTITVNFGDKAYTMADGTVLGALSQHTEIPGPE
ncbi:MAG: carbohydrate binding domain-containing protein [Candidatus Nealsonbacteria bacterium]|nr:carbohydrate binding domain-containing protein [Candidatus Nealsonbacteria bacterium]